MDNFEIEPNTDADLGFSIPDAKNEMQQNLHSLHDQLNIKMCVLACAIKIAYILMYFLLRVVADSYLGCFISTSILVSIDFWVTKNLTGRTLVGLRWWSQLSQNGEEQWIFQSRSAKKSAHKANASFFWLPQLLTNAFWLVLFVINLITLSFFIASLDLFCLMLGGINFICYFKCRGEHQSKAKEITAKVGFKKQIF